MSTTSCLYHIVFNTHNRKMAIDPLHEEDLYRYLWSIIRQRNCELKRVGGIANHIHLLINLHPSVSLADLVGELKRKSSLWMKRSGLFPRFEGWGREYFAFSKSEEHRGTVIEYIKNQKAHHSKLGFEEEMREIVARENQEWNECMLT